MGLVQKIKAKLVGTGDANSQARNKNIFKAIFVTVIARVINMGSGLITVPVTLKYLGTEQFAIWMAITSFVGFLNFADLGLGIGLQNALAKCNGKDDKENPRHYVSNTYFLLSVIAVPIILMALYLLPLLPVEKLIKVEANQSAVSILPTLQVFVVLFAIGLPVGVIQRVLTGYQKSHIFGNLLVIGRLLGLISIFVSIGLKQSLPVLAGLFVGLPTLVQFIYTIYYFRKNSWIAPSFQLLGKKYLKEITGTGIWSVLAQVAFTIKMNVPLLIISTVIGATAVAQYTITQRLLGVVGMLINLGLQPLWPAYGEAYHRGDKEWLVATFRKSLKLVLMLTVPLFFIMSLAGIPLIRLWTGSEDVVPPLALLLACNLWMVISNWNVSCAMLLNGSNHLKGQATFGLALIVVACTIAYGYGVRFGVAGVIWTIVLISEILFGVLLFIEANLVIKDMKNDIE